MRLRNWAEAGNGLVDSNAVMELGMYVGLKDG